MAIRQAVRVLGQPFIHRTIHRARHRRMVCSLGYRPSSKRCVVPGLVENAWWRSSLAGCRVRVKVAVFGVRLHAVLQCPGLGCMSLRGWWPVMAKNVGCDGGVG